MRGEPCIVLQALLHVQFLWQHSAASDCNQERQPIAVPYTLQFLFFSAAAHVFFSKAEAGWKSGMATTARGGVAFPMAGSSIGTNSVAQ